MENWLKLKNKFKEKEGKEKIGRKNNKFQSVKNKEKDSKATEKKNAATAYIIGKYIAMDCEFVGVGVEGKEHALARVSIVNYEGDVVFDEYVKPAEKVVDYRTWVSGILPDHLINAPSWIEVQKRVGELIKDRILIGHGLENDFKTLMINHPRKLIRDTSTFSKFRALKNGRTPSLKLLAEKVLCINIQGGSHSSVEDARAAMLLYRKVKKEWEQESTSKNKKR
ncbi:hypothetical protein ROZALSC1DRAFT_14453 [Rozella allomycis CSF55]|uniref:RNA exonuclease 4 n=1 Tax=Rozella allomycis (strain CSF55) TaxID=988480 RepID=A0A4P9YJR2_ROZAC|nr:hypothetical protein ROZALSC1DRAFT_14453 [Rozella allomycis CSF55]